MFFLQNTWCALKAASRLNAEVEEGGKERGEAGYKLTAGLGTRTNKLCERDKWAMY
jgi:hypothetical protein